MRVSKLLVSSVLFVMASYSSAQVGDSDDAIIFGHDLGWLKLINASGLNVVVSDEVSDGCWTNISSVRNAVELQLIRSGYETYTDDDQSAFAPTIRVQALGFEIPSINACAVTAEISVMVAEIGDIESEEGFLRSIYTYQLASYKGIFTANKSNSNESVRSQFEDLTQTMLVDAQKKKQDIRKALMEHRETPVTQFWIRQLE